MGRLQIKFETVSDVSDEDENKKSKNENSKKPVKPSTGTEGVFDFKEDETDGE